MCLGFDVSVSTALNLYRITSQVMDVDSFAPLSQMKNWKRRYFMLDENAVSYYKSDLVRKDLL